MTKQLAIPLFAFLLLPPCRAQDPPVPSGGFPVQEILDQTITYADGYTSRLDIRLPDPALSPPAATGWPLIVVAHGLAIGHHRKNEAARCTEITRRGYITVCHDVRGQGDAMRLNTTGGTDINGAADKGDLVEVIHHVKAQLGAHMDFQRLGVFGFSQGGWLAWGAAAYSGRTLPAPRGVHTRFPTLACVATGGMVPDNLDLFLPEGACFSPLAAVGGFAPEPVIEPQLQAALANAWLQQDPGLIAPMLRNDPWRQERPFLRSSVVPTFVELVWDDENIGERHAVDAVAALPTSTPRFVFVHNTGHGAPANDLTEATVRELRLRWFDRFLKGTADELPQQRPFLLSEVPADLVEYFDPRTVLQTRQFASFPATGTAATLLHLRGQNRLTQAPPGANEAPDTIVHQVPATFGPFEYVMTGGVAAAVRAAVPHASVAYRSDPLPASRELVGRPRATLWIDSGAPHLQVSVALFDEGPNGVRRYVTSGFRVERNRTPGTSNHVVELAGTDYLFEAGHRLVLAVENLAWHRPPGIDSLFTAPFLTTYSFDCLHTTARPSRLELPLTEPALGARTTRTTLQSWQANVVPVAIEGGSSRAGHGYLTLLSLSGTVPGNTLFGTHVPINVDLVTSLALQTTYGPFVVGFVGMLDAAGRGGSSLLVPRAVLTPLDGGRLSFTVVTVGPRGEFAASAASQVSIRP